MLYICYVCRAITQSPVDGFQNGWHFWNPCEKHFDSYFMVCTRAVAISRKNKRLKKEEKAVILIEKLLTRLSFAACTPTIWVSMGSL